MQLDMISVVVRMSSSLEVIFCSNYALDRWYVKFLDPGEESRVVNQQSASSDQRGRGSDDRSEVITLRAISPQALQGSERLTRERW